MSKSDESGGPSGGKSNVTDDLRAAVAYVRDGTPPSGVGSFGDLFLFSEDERVQMFALRDLVKRYVTHPEPSRPLCIGVFGPPGSGKSFAVEQIQAAIEAELEPLKLPMTTLNLTQTRDVRQLASALLKVKDGATAASVPLVFFDEFDAPREGTPLGWLGWFLAPMHDGAFIAGAEPVFLKRAVYVFAGGTAATFDAFNRPRDTKGFREAKGPDFISRLRGFLDVCGPNAERRELRRAVLLRGELKRRAKAGDTGQASRVSPDAPLLEALLRNGRYRHGSRSISAVIEMSTVEPAPRPKEEARLTHGGLPDRHLLALHSDRGPLDPGRIDGYVSYSGGRQGPPAFSAAWKRVATRLWEHGATIVYGGSWSGSPMEALLQETARLPRAVRREGEATEPVLVSITADLPNPQAGESSPVVQVVRTGHELSPEERLLRTRPKRLEDPWLADVLALFRMRLQVAESSVACVAMGGKLTGYHGRFPGVWEEVMLALARGLPVYVLGIGEESAATHLGHMLALSRPWSGEPIKGARPELELPRMRLLPELAGKLRPPPWKKLPVTLDELVDFLTDHALGGPRWPENGLSVQENRALFACDDPEAATALVLRGLLRRFAAE